VKTCPRCTLISPDTATHCDCGFDFASSLAEEQVEVKARVWEAAWGVPTGLVVLGMAIALSVGTRYLYLGLALAGVGLVMTSIKRVFQFLDARRAIRDEAARKPRRRFRRP
jgi:hypothetical protein